MNKQLRIFIIIACFVVAAAAQGYSQSNQSQTGAEPIGGINKLVLEYYRIDFTKEQRKVLQDNEIEFIYSIDQDGVATLEEIKGVNDKAIRDSLQQVTSRLPRFKPGTVDGNKVSSLYLLKIEFPSYRPTAENPAFQEAIWYQEADYDDFEYIHKSGRRLDAVFGGAANAFLGDPGKYLGPGGGMKVEVMVTGKKGVGAGMVMSFYGNKLKQKYPITSGRDQNTAPPTMLLGLGLNKILVQKERKEFNLQAEFNYAIQNVVPPIGDSGEGLVQLKGFSPGLVGNYLIQIGKNKTSYYYGSPTILNHYINLHAAIWPVFFNLKQATGLMTEIGLSWRLGTHFVDEYKLKPKAN
jgi:hypothetical protein